MTTEVKICFIGDSIINGACDKTMLGWTGRVCADAYRKSGSLTYYNLGVRGDTSSTIIKRYQDECESRLQNAEDARVVLSCGINDTVIVDGRQNIDTSVSCQNIENFLRDTTKYQTLLISPSPVNDQEHNKRIELLSKEFATISNSFNIPYIDIFTPLVNDSIYIQDIINNQNCFPAGYHPTEFGYKMIADIINNSPGWWFYKT